jgi:hypothetical protein
MDQSVCVHTLFLEKKVVWTLWIGESSEEMFEVGEGVGSRVRIDQVEMGGGLSR